MEDLDRARIAEAVKAARVARGWSKEEAARQAKISSITWKRVEDGLRVQDVKLRAIENTFGWEYGSVQRISVGRPPVEVPQDDVTSFPRTHKNRDAKLQALLNSAWEFARYCRDLGVQDDLVEDYHTYSLSLFEAASKLQEGEDWKRVIAGDEGYEEVIRLLEADYRDALERIALLSEVMEERYKKHGPNAPTPKFFLSELERQRTEADRRYQRLQKAQALAAEHGKLSVEARFKGLSSDHGSAEE